MDVLIPWKLTRTCSDFLGCNRSNDSSFNLNWWDDKIKDWDCSKCEYSESLSQLLDDYWITRWKDLQMTIWKKCSGSDNPNLMIRPGTDIRIMDSGIDNLNQYFWFWQSESTILEVTFRMNSSGSDNSNQWFWKWQSKLKVLEVTFWVKDLEITIWKNASGSNDSNQGLWNWHSKSTILKVTS